MVRTGKNSTLHLHLAPRAAALLVATRAPDIIGPNPTGGESGPGARIGQPLGSANRVLLTLLALCVSACTPLGINRTFYQNGTWTGLSGPAEVQDALLCMSAGAQGADVVAQAVEDSVVPSLYEALGRSRAAAKSRRIDASGTVCRDLANFVSTNFESNFQVGARLRQSLDRSFQTCGGCNTVVVPAVFLSTSAATTELKGSNGHTVLSYANGRTVADGNFNVHVYVFTKSGELAFNGRSDYYLPTWNSGIRPILAAGKSIADKAVQNFPRHIL